VYESLGSQFNSDVRGGDNRPETDMDSSFTIKPNAAVPKFTPRERSPARPITTELDAAKTVAAIADGESGQREPRQEHPPHDVVVDPESREVINRENDVRAQSDAREHPDQALLRYRAYRPARSESDNTAPAEPHANIKA
jgi:hypothetical protein